MVSKSPMKAKEFKEHIQIEKLPFGKLIYSYTEKENNTGFSKNSRLLLMDTISGMIGYYNEAEIPTIPIGSYENLQKKPMKKKAPISSMSYLKLKDKPTIQIKVKEVDFKGKKTDEKWSFNFKLPKIAEDWIREMDEAKKFLAEKPPIGQTMPPHNTGNSNVQPMSMSVVRNPPVYPNELLLSNAAENDNRNQSQKLPIDRDEHLGSQLIYQTTEYNDRLAINSSYRPPYPAEENVSNSRLSGNRSPQIGSSSIRMTGSKIQPNPIGTSHISNTNYNPQPSLVNDTSSYRPGVSGVNINPTNPSNSTVQPINPINSTVNPMHSAVNPNPNTSYSRITPAPNYSRYSEVPINPVSPPVTIGESKFDPKRSSNVGESRTERPPIYQSGNDRDWNLQFLNSSNPIQTLMDFRSRAQQAARGIIDQQGTIISKRKYSPWKKEKYDIYIVGSLIIYIAFLTEEEIQYKQLKNEFRNYNYILNATENRQSIKVPLAVFVDYKGIAALVKARIPKSEEISFNSIYHELDELEKVTNVDKEILKTHCIFHKLVVSKNTYIFIDDLKEFLPFDVQASEQSSQLRGELVENNGEVLPGGHYTGKKSDHRNKGFSQLDEAARKMREYGGEIATMIENMDVVILNSNDLKKQLHLNGVSIRCLGQLAGQCQNPLIKKYFVSEVASRVCKKIIKSQLQQQIRRMEGQKSQLSNLEPTNMVLLDVAFFVLNDIVSQNDRTDRIWRIVIQEVKRKYNLTFSREDLSVGYFLSSLFQKSGLTFNYQYLSKDKNYFRAPNCLRKDFVTGFQMDTNSYHIGFCEEYRKLNQILNSDPSEEGFGDLVDLLRLRTSKLPEYTYAYDLDSRIKRYMGDFISYGSQEYSQLGIYSGVGQQPPTLSSIKQSLIAMKWLKKTPQDQNGNIIFEVATDLISFWGGQYHPLLSDLYDFVASTHAISGNYEASLSLAKSSLANCIKVSGANSLAAGEKYYQLGEVFFKMGKKEDALTNYQITRQILQANKKTNIDDYGYIALKLAMLNLNFSKNSEAASKALQALRIFESPPVKQQSMLETYEVLARAYQISNQKAQLLNLSSLCSKKLPTISNPRVYERMLKVVLYPHMIGLNQSAAKDLLMIYEQIDKGASQSQATEFLKIQTSEHSGLQFPNKLQKIDRILGEIHNKNLITKYKGLSMANQGEAEQFLAYLQAIGTVLGDNFIMGVLIEASE